MKILIICDHAYRSEVPAPTCPGFEPDPLRDKPELTWRPCKHQNFKMQSTIGVQCTSEKCLRLYLFKLLGFKATKLDKDDDVHDDVGV